MNAKGSVIARSAVGVVAAAGFVAAAPLACSGGADTTLTCGPGTTDVNAEGSPRFFVGREFVLCGDGCRVHVDAAIGYEGAAPWS